MRRSITLLLRAALAMCVVGSIVGPIPARAQTATPPEVAPTITGPYEGCGATWITGNDEATVSGTATPGATISSAVLRQFDADGDPIAGSDRNVPVSLDHEGQLSGTIENVPNTASTVALVVTVAKDGLERTGESNHLSLDTSAPAITSATTTSDSTIRVTFSEPVVIENGDSGLDWFVYGDETKKPLLVTGTGSMRVLRFAGITFGHDELVPLRYRTYPGRTPYNDCVDQSLAAEGRIRTTADGILPDVPEISEVAGVDATDGSVAATESSPVVTIEGLLEGHEAELVREANGTPGLQNDDHVVDTATAAGGSAMIADSLAGDNNYTYYARAIDANGNFSDGHAAVDYRLDRTAPTPLGARTNGETVTVTFDEAISGRDDAGDWAITFPGGADEVTIVPTAVEGTGDTRVLDAPEVPNGARVNYTRPASDGYVDEVGNELQSFSSLSTVGMAPAVIDVEPEQLAEAVTSPHETSATVVDDAGVLVPGATVWFRVVSGPNSTHDIDGDPSTPVGVIGGCLTQADGACSVSHSSQELGTDVVQGWVGEVTDLTIPEPRAADGSSDLPLQDVVQTDWVAEGADLILDVSPESSSGRINEPHVADVAVTSVGDEADAAPIGGVNVDAIVIDGPNAGTHIGECTTDAAGACREPISFNSEVVGIDVIQYWIDVDGDNSTIGEADPAESVDADTAATPEGDGSGARLAADDAEASDDPGQDVVTRSWAGEAIPHVDAEPEQSQGTTGIARSLRFTTTDETGAKLEGLNVDARVVSGPNAGSYLGGCSTSATGECLLNNYSSMTAGNDVIQVWIDANGNNIADEATDAEQRDESSGTDEPDQDVVAASWTTPQSGTPGGGSGGGNEPGGGGGGNDPGTTPDGPGTRSLTIASSASKVGFRRSVELSGSVASTAGCGPAAVDILRSSNGTDFTVISTAAVTGDGTWTLTLRPENNAVYRAHAAEDELCAAASSDDVSIDVRASVTAVRRNPLSACDLIRGRVSPSKAGQTVRLQRHASGGWRSVRRTELGSRSGYSFSACSAGRYRVLWGGDDANLRAVSRAIGVAR